MPPIRPGRWTVSPALIDPVYQDLWKGMVAYMPLWGDGYDVVYRVMGSIDPGIVFVNHRITPWGEAPFWGAGTNADSIDLHDRINDALDGSSGITMFALVRSEGNNQRRIISSSTGANEADHYYMINQQGTAIRMRLKAGGSTTTLASATGVFPDLKWVFAFGVYDGANMRLYTATEGESYRLIERTSVAKTGTIDATGPVPVLGNVNATFSDSSAVWNGWIVTAGIWNRALSVREMQHLVRDPFGVIRPLAFEVSTSPTTSLLANADGSSVDIVNELDATSPLWSSVDDDPDSPTDSDWVNNATGVD